MLNTDESKRILSEFIKRQMAVLGREVTIARVRNVPGINVDDSGNILSVAGDTQAILQDLINQFVEFSGIIVKRVLEAIIIAGIERVSSGYNQNADATNFQNYTVNKQGVVESSPQFLPNDYGTGTAPEEDGKFENTTRDVDALNRMIGNLKYRYI